MIDIAEYKKACKDYEERWPLLNNTLYRLCEENPGHSSLSTINAKFFVIGRTYASGIERLKRNQGSVPSATLNMLTQHVYENRKQVDPIFTELSNISEPLSAKTLEIIVNLHRRFLNILMEVLDRGVPRSFASKYLHFHCPAVPIYDSIASKQVAVNSRGNKVAELFDMPKDADKIYYRFLMDFKGVYDDAYKRGLKPTVRLIDNYLLYIDTEGRHRQKKTR